jgi:cell division septal protein FtsQ
MSRPARGNGNCTRPARGNGGRHVRRGQRRPGRRKRILAWAAGITISVLLLAAVGGYLVYYHLDSNIHQVDISGTLGLQPGSRASSSTT